MESGCALQMSQGSRRSSSSGDGDGSGDGSSNSSGSHGDAGAGSGAGAGAGAGAAGSAGAVNKPSPVAIEAAEMLPPGSITYLQRAGTCVYATSAPSTDFDTILVAASCVRDHMMDSYGAALRKCLSRIDPDIVQQ